MAWAGVSALSKRHRIVRQSSLRAQLARFLAHRRRRTRACACCISGSSSRRSHGTTPTVASCLLELARKASKATSVSSGD